MPRTGRRLLVAVLLATSACQQQGTPAPSQFVHVSPAAVLVAPGGNVQFTATSAWGSDVIWSMQPETEGSIDQAGLFTASSRPLQTSGLCTVLATLRSDPSRMGLAIVTIQLLPPVNMVAASGQQQQVEGTEIESVALEPIAATTSQDSSGFVESRGGFYPSGSTSNP